MSTLERTYQKGLAAGEAQGIAKGKTEGKAEGRAETILRQLQKRFGPLSDAVIARVRGGALHDLDVWTDRILDAVTLEDVFVDWRSQAALLPHGRCLFGPGAVISSRRDTEDRPYSSV